VAIGRVEGCVRGKIAGNLVICLLGGILGIHAQTADPGSATRVIEVSARKYEFDPPEIHVKKGARVQLRVHSVDETHGIKLSLTPEGGNDKAAPGLLFANSADNGNVEKNQDQVLEFVAQQSGTYEFKCAKVCGIHHGKMKGKLVVEE
jgi:cytochrome c oxidase subunit 2